MNYMVGYLIPAEQTDNNVPMFVNTLECMSYDTAVVAREYLAGQQPNWTWYVVQLAG